MSEIEKKVEVEEEEIEGDEFQSDETTDWKARAEELERKRKEDGIRNRERTKALKAELETLKPKPQDKIDNKKGFNYGEKAFLKTSGIQSDEYDFVNEIMGATGKSLDDVLESKYFQAELKERRQNKESRDALPSGSRRSASAVRDSVEYHLANDTSLMKIEDVVLRRKVLKARQKLRDMKSRFTERPIV